MEYVSLALHIILTYLVFLCLMRLADVLEEIEDLRQDLHRKIDAEMMVTQDLNTRLQYLQNSRFSQMRSRDLNRTDSR